MEVTRGSFYHHFKNFDDFVDKLLAHWVERYSRELIAKSESRDIATQIQIQTEFAINLPHGAEAALRAWGTINPSVAAAQRKVEQLRHQGLVESLCQHGVPREKADTYATIALATLAGMQMTQAPFDASALRTVYEELAQALGKNVTKPRRSK